MSQRFRRFFNARRLRCLAKAGRRWYLATISPVVFRRRMYLYVVTRMASCLAAARGTAPISRQMRFHNGAMGTFPMADPRQGMSYFMQDGVPDFMRRLQVGTDEMDGKSNAFFLKAAYAQPPPCPVPPELPVMQPVFIQFQTGIGFYLPEAGWSAGLFIPRGHVKSMVPRLFPGRIRTRRS